MCRGAKNFCKEQVGQKAKRCRLVKNDVLASDPSTKRTEAPFTGAAHKGKLASSYFPANFSKAQTDR